jgi:hypothetical protein
LADTSPDISGTASSSISTVEGVFIIAIDEMTKSVFLWLEKLKIGSFYG